MPESHPVSQVALGYSQKCLLLFINGYRRWVSPMTAPSCRFMPTCSAYAIEAITKHGAAKGTVLTTKRLCKCHPFCSQWGYDPVP